MALVFNTKPVAVLKASDNRDRSATRTITGITTANTTPDNAAAQVNKLLGIAGEGIVANEKMTIVETKEAVDNG